METIFRVHSSVSKTLECFFLAIASEDGEAFLAVVVADKDSTPEEGREMVTDEVEEGVTCGDDDDKDSTPEDGREMLSEEVEGGVTFDDDGNDAVVGLFSGLY